MTSPAQLQNLSDEALMLRVRDGDETSFALLLQRYEKQIINFFYRQLSDYELAKDLLMDTFLRIYQAAERYEPRAKFSTYIYQIARNLSINEFKKREIRKTDSLEDLDESTGLEIADGKLNAAEIMEQHETQRMVQDALNSLTEEHRTILILTEFQDLPYDKVAQIMGCSVGTVKSRMFRARQKIKEWMECHGL
jgi:RNA polymerase sigma-70 factor, ECF subfamily